MTTPRTREALRGLVEALRSQPVNLHMGGLHLTDEQKVWNAAIDKVLALLTPPVSAPSRWVGTDLSYQALATKRTAQRGLRWVSA